MLGLKYIMVSLCINVFACILETFNITMQSLNKTEQLLSFPPACPECQRLFVAVIVRVHLCVSLRMPLCQTFCCEQTQTR